MKKLIFYKANEYWSIPPEDIVYIKGAGNYSIFTLLSDIKDGKKESFTLTFQLGHTLKVIETQLKAADIKGVVFARIYKSAIVNLSYIHRINPSKRELILSDARTFSINLVKEINEENKKNEENEKNKKLSKEVLSELKSNLESILPDEVKSVMKNDSEKEK